MRNTLKAVLLLSICVLPGAVLAQPGGDEAQKEINYLLEFVATTDCTFIRDGERYDGAEAAKHLTEKYDQDRRHVTSADKFIDRVASKSALTGNPYTVNCDGEAEPSDVWLHRALAKYRNESDPLRDP